MINRFRAEQLLLACSLSLIGLAVAGLILLRATDPRRVAASVTR